MNCIEIEVLKPEAALESFARTWQGVENAEELTPRLAFGSLRELFSAITQKRLEMVRFVAENGDANIQQLAHKLGRNYKNVHTDAKALLELGLLEQDDAGILTAPFDEIVIHAPLRDVA